MALRIITGPPAAGKTTYVNEHARRGDIRIDYDAIANLLSGGDPDSHTHPTHIKGVAKATRQAAIDAALPHSDKRNVWIIHSHPTADALATYRKHGAEIVTIDPGEEVVMRRIKEQRPKAMHAVAARWYKQQAQQGAQHREWERATKRKRTPRSAPGNAARTATPDTPTPAAPTTTQRGLGYAHQKNRERTLAQMLEGEPCWWCGRPMHRDQALHADHTISRSHGGHTADRMLHGACNAQRQDGRYDHRRPALNTPDGLPMRPIQLKAGGVDTRYPADPDIKKGEAQFKWDAITQ